MNSAQEFNPPERGLLRFSSTTLLLAINDGVLDPYFVATRSYDCYESGSRPMGPRFDRWAQRNGFIDELPPPLSPDALTINCTIYADAARRALDQANEPVDVWQRSCPVFNEHVSMADYALLAAANAISEQAQTLGRGAREFSLRPSTTLIAHLRQAVQFVFETVNTLDALLESAVNERERTP